ncbi:hypothetical protein [Gymnodinialimonas ceratoperidinii]|uniref:Uncharacterized protein n=1 Tax=Gymnodinialimonas ceratoperidinii TaxID=2856823 RepID=A0A8F6YB11_9RHOB|nr:hypothetical protein [Gymnodinialimonas ceratoperidinii]QXT40494.1 hypothetical protein KYE46_04410 [Gymnodinialimonas ceratoperidinii]
MAPIRLIIIGGAVIALLGASYLSYYGVGRESRDLAAAGPPSVRAGSTGSGGGFFAFGRIK